MPLLAKWLRLQPGDRWLVFQMACLLAAIRLGLKILPLRRLRSILTWLATAFPGFPHADPIDKERIAWAAQAAGSHLLGDHPCLSQALAVDFCLMRHRCPGVIHIGVARGQDGELVAHAWVESDGKVLIGGSQKELERYTRLLAIDGESR